MENTSIGKKGSSVPKIIPVPAANAAILKDGKILLTERAAHLREAGKWCIPGGHVEPGETWWDAMVREVEEEVGLKVSQGCLLGIYSDPSLTVTPAPYYGEFHGQFVVATFLVTGFGGEVKPNEEVSKWDWFELRSLPFPLLRSHTIRVEDAFRFKGVPFVR